MTTHQSLMLAAGVGVLQNISVSSEVVTARNWAESSRFFCHPEHFCETAGKRHDCCFTSICKKSELGCFSDYYKEISLESERCFILCFSLGCIDLCWWWSNLLSLWAFQFSVPSMFCSWPLSVFPPPLLWCYFLLHAEVTTASLFLDCVRGGLSSLFTTRKSCSNKGTLTSNAFSCSLSPQLLSCTVGRRETAEFTLVSLWRRLLL